MNNGYKVRPSHCDSFKWPGKSYAFTAFTRLQLNYNHLLINSIIDMIIGYYYAINTCVKRCQPTIWFFHQFLFVRQTTFAICASSQKTIFLCRWRRIQISSLFSIYVMLLKMCKVYQPLFLPCSPVSGSYIEQIFNFPTTIFSDFSSTKVFNNR